ncbi:cell division protein FtsQ/DivIB [Oceanobacillus sp. CAU 1775]
MEKNKKNIVSIEDRIPKLKEARKKKANRRLVFYLSIFFLLILIIVYLQSPLSQVKTIDVQNNSFISDDEVVEISGIKIDSNIWSLDFENMEAILKGNPIIDEVSIERQLPNTVVFEVTEKRIVSFFEQGASYYPVLENGTVLTEAEFKEFNGQAPLMVGFTDTENLSIIASELNKLSDEILSLISEIHQLPEDNNQSTVMMYMNDGFVVKAATRNFSEGMSAYPSVVAQLDPETNGMIHVGVGVYFEEFIEETEDDLETEEDAEVE